MLIQMHEELISRSIALGCDRVADVTEGTKSCDLSQQPPPPLSNKKERFM